MKKILSFLFFFGILLSGEVGASVLFNQKWNKDFELRGFENGDSVSIGAMACDNKNLFLYDQARGKIVSLSTNGKILKSTSLQIRSRGTYFGVDFTHYNSHFVFVNDIDKKLDFYNSSTGKYIKSQEIPPILQKETKRSNRVVNRIYSQKGNLYIGNEYRVFPVLADSSLQKKVMITTAPVDSKIIYLDDSLMVTSMKSKLYKNGKSLKSPLPTNHYPIQGKRICSINKIIYVLTLQPQGPVIEELR